MEKTIEKTLFASRWLLTPIYLGLSLLGIIRLNAKANILVLDKNLNLKEIYLNGKKINE